MLVSSVVNRAAACLGLFCTVVDGHAYMYSPVAFPSQYLENYPVKDDGSDWPCKGEKNYDRSGIINIWDRGSQQHLQAFGGASHGGGSCQISVTTDLKPTRHTKWRVIHSIEGGCPIRNYTEGNWGDSPSVLLPSIYNFTIPEWLPIGELTMAWTWHGRFSVPEMFMNCAPILVRGSPHQDRNMAEEDLTRPFYEQPLIFEANNGNGCFTQNKGSCIKYPEPGLSLVVNEECPLDETKMLRGTCGPKYTIENMSWIYFVGLKTWFAVIFLFSVVLLVSYMGSVAYKQRRHKYSKVADMALD